MNAPAVILPDPAIVESVIIKGDLAALNAQQRTEYYLKVCEVCGLNPLTQPFAYIKLSGKDTLYATKSCAEQLRMLHNISVEEVTARVDSDTYIVTTKVKLANGRTDASIGAVTIGNVRGEARANAMMKAETKSKRRATLSICGLGFLLDESELPDETFQRLPAPPAPNVILPPAMSPTLAADSPRAPSPTGGEPASLSPDEPPGEAAGDAGSLDSQKLLAYDQQLSTAADTGDMDRLQAAWDTLPTVARTSLKAALERRHKPRVIQVMNDAKRGA